MAVKKTLIGQLVRDGQRWVLTLQSSDANILRDIIETVRESAKKHDAVLLNAADPFGDTRKFEGEKPRKLRSDKGIKRNVAKEGA